MQTNELEIDLDKLESTYIIIKHQATSEVWRNIMGALGILAAVVVLVGGVQSTVNVADAGSTETKFESNPVIEVQAIQQAPQNGN